MKITFLSGRAAAAVLGTWRRRPLACHPAAARIARRRAATRHDARRRYDGRMDTVTARITPEGARQARALARRLAVERDETTTQAEALAGAVAYALDHVAEVAAAMRRPGYGGRHE